MQAMRDAIVSVPKNVPARKDMFDPLGWFDPMSLQRFEVPAPQADATGCQLERPYCIHNE